MSEETAVADAVEETKVEEATAEVTEETPEVAEIIEDISYHAVEKEGSITAIWEMQGRKHVRTIDPRSGEGKQILALFETAG
ncbi:MAG: hypothetical protein HC846_05260 [Blastocatellia bacterium]|nr:hypothetical protein [Blastocatellia bacterium]